MQPAPPHLKPDPSFDGSVKSESVKMPPQGTLKPDLDPSFDSSANASSSKQSVISDSVEKPLFVLADWVTRFLPTLYHVLFCSDKPFHDFSRGSLFVATVQRVLDAVYPGNTYIVTSMSKVYTAVQYLFLCLICSLITLVKCRHMIGSLRNGLISAYKLYVWSKHISKMTNSETTPVQ